ncbi:hypothetical protein T11_12947 [Trichinella zimbabwensis]|uniref:Uncharacterized protein n=1 Tax=Trichinella zimbabwensis TaxID=268475 RepID=A0A0V1I8H5_9BILA|nr:hypothetical protein T11_12947 [Trichinella zimbabwensis]
MQPHLRSPKCWTKTHRPLMDAPPAGIQSEWMVYAEFALVIKQYNASIEGVYGDKDYLWSEFYHCDHPVGSNFFYVFHVLELYILCYLDILRLLSITVSNRIFAYFATEIFPHKSSSRYHES